MFGARLIRRMGSLIYDDVIRSRLQNWVHKIIHGSLVSSSKNN